MKRVYLEECKDQNNIIDVDLLENIKTKITAIMEGLNIKNWYHFNNDKILFKIFISPYGNYAEVLYSKLAKMCGVKYADYMPAKKGKYDGVLVFDFIEDDMYISGREIIARGLGYEEYESMDINIECNKKNNLNDIRGYLNKMFYKDVQIVDSIILDLIKMFTLDVLTCNKDRHTDNWGILIGDGDKDIRLAPSFDNESIANLDFDQEYFENTIEDILKSDGSKTINQFTPDRGFSILSYEEDTPHYEQLVNLYKQSDENIRKEIENIVSSFNIKGAIQAMSEDYNKTLPVEVKLFVETSMNFKKDIVEKKILQVKRAEKFEKIKEKYKNKTISL